MKTFGIQITAEDREHFHQVQAWSMTEALQEAAKIADHEYLDIESVNVEEFKTID